MLDKKWHESVKNSSCRGRKEQSRQLCSNQNALGGEPNKIDEGSGAVVFLWEGERWYNEFDEIAFVEEFMDNLPHEDFLFIRLGEDYDDIETRGSYWCNPQRVRIAREIAAD